MFLKLPVALFGAVILFGQPQDPSLPPSAPADSPAATSTGNLSYEPVNAGDLIYIYVANDVNLTRSYRVGVTGAISLPGLGVGLAVAGLAPNAIESVVRKGLIASKLLVDPVVSVTVLEYRSRPVEVSGAVKHPSTIQALGNLRLLDALAKCDGLEENAGFEILVLRNSGTAGAEEVHIPVQALLDGSDPQLNIPLRGGEQIRVPRAGKIYVVGNVRAPGAFPITDADGISVLKALGLCQGLLPYSRDNALVYRLSPGSSQRTEVPVPVRAILKHHAADFQLNASDILYVPDNTGKRLTGRALERISGVGATASTVLMWKAVP